MNNSTFDAHKDLSYGSFSYKGFDLPYRYYIPEIKDKTKKYPLVLFLHGAGERGTDNELQLKNMICEFFTDPNSPIYDSFVIAPQCPKEMKWVEANWSNGSYYEDDDSLASPALRATLELINKTIEENSIDKKHVYSIGLSMGGYGTWYLLTHRSDLFAGGVPVCGGGNPSLAEKVVPLAVHAFHSSDDPTVPVEGSRSMVDAIKKAGGKRIRYTEYNYTGHGSWTAAARTPGLLEWLFEQTKE